MLIVARRFNMTTFRTEEDGPAASPKHLDLTEMMLRQCGVSSYSWTWIIFKMDLCKIHKAESTIVIAPAAEIGQMTTSIQYFGALNLPGNGILQKQRYDRHPHRKPYKNHDKK